MTISQAIDGFVKYKVVEGLSERTLESYLDHLSRFQGRVDDVHLAKDVLNDFVRITLVDEPFDQCMEKSMGIKPLHASSLGDTYQDLIQARSTQMMSLSVQHQEKSVRGVL